MMKILATRRDEQPASLSLKFTRLGPAENSGPFTEYYSSTTMVVVQIE
jgi:hypothetical protein